jgi:hypothetical protein
VTTLGVARADIRICGIFDDRDDSRSPLVVRGVPKLGTLADLVAFVRAAEIDMLIVMLPLNADRRIREVRRQSRYFRSTCGSPTSPRTRRSSVAARGRQAAV